VVEPVKRKTAQQFVLAPEEFAFLVELLVEEQEAVEGNAPTQDLEFAQPNQAPGLTQHDLPRA
jgi:hypothetical protein